MKIIATRKHIAKSLGWDSRTVTKVLKQLGITHSGVLTPFDLAVLERKTGGFDYQQPQRLAMLAYIEKHFGANSNSGTLFNQNT